jgi:4-hydroxy-tetrahydrodipicolinate synthase
MVAAAEAKTWARANLRGLLTSPLTIFRDNFDLDHEALEFNVEHILRVGVEGMGYGHGEPWSLSLGERKESTEHFLAAVGNRALRYVHTFSHSAPDTVDLTNHAADHGADLVMIEAPYEHAKSDGQILRYFQYVAERTDLGIIVLNTPHSGRLLATALLDELADIPAVCALKDGINDWTTVSLHVRAIGDRVVVSHPREEEALSSVMYLGQQVQLGTSASRRRVPRLVSARPAAQPMERDAHLALGTGSRAPDCQGQGVVGGDGYARRRSAAPEHRD